MDIPRLDLTQTPAAPPPQGVIPNFIDPPLQANVPRIFTYVTLPPMILLLGMRVYTRYSLTRKFGLDDYLCILASATILVYIILIFTILDNPSGPHMWDIPVSKITVSYVRMSFITQLLYMVAAMFAKTAILALYQRIFGPSRLSRILILSGIVFNVGFYISMFIFSAVGCIPKSEDYASGGWLSPKVSERCTRSASHTTTASGVVGAVVDIYILLLPLFLILHLHTSKKRKAGLAFIFILGSVACVFSIVGAYYRFKHIAADHDYSWSTMPLYGLSIAEITVGISCSCIPVAFVLFKNMAEKSSTWASHFWYNLTDGDRRAADPSDSKNGQVDQPFGFHRLESQLPQAPKASMMGPRSFFDKFGRSNARTQTGADMDDLGLTMMSREYDYHQHLRAGTTDR